MGTCNNINTIYGFRFDQHEEHTTSDFEDVTELMYLCVKILASAPQLSRISFTLQLIVHCKIILVL